MEKKDSNKEKKITRKDFIRAGVTMAAVAVVTGILGCRETGRPNVPLAQYPNFAGNSVNKVYHKPTCKLAPDSSKAVYFDAPDMAHRAGYRPCAVCKPQLP